MDKKPDSILGNARGTELGTALDSKLGAALANKLDSEAARITCDRGKIVRDQIRESHQLITCVGLQGGLGCIPDYCATIVKRCDFD